LVIKEIKIRKMKLSLKNPFTTSFGTLNDKEFLIIEVKDELGNVGWGESVAFSTPWYTEETVKTNLHMIKDFLIPLVLDKKVNHPEEVNEIFRFIKRNNMAKSAVESAIWDAYAKRRNKSLAEVLGGTKEKIKVGISIGIKKDVVDLIESIRQAVNKGSKRVKVKIKPGYDIEVLREIRKYFPDILLMADANSAYSLDDIQLLKQLDEFNLMMIEQPLASDDIIDHATLQNELNTPICLDESIHSLEDTRKAIQLGSCQIINIKIGRVGGLTEAKKIHDYCLEKNIPVWCGGMLEAGIGRAHNIALTSLPNFILPGDTEGSAHYWEEDIITPEVVVENGEITIPEKEGIGFAPNLQIIDKYTIDIKSYQA